MNQFSLRYLYAHLGEALQKMPFQITNHNRVVAVVDKPSPIGNLNKIRLVADPLVPEGTIEFRNSLGELVGKTTLKELEKKAK